MTHAGDALNGIPRKSSGLFFMVPRTKLDSVWYLKPFRRTKHNFSLFALNSEKIIKIISKRLLYVFLWLYR